MERNKIIHKLNIIAHAKSPLVTSYFDDRVLLKLEGYSTNLNHKFRSASYVIKNALENGVNLSKVVDRSSGSWAVALSHCTYIAGGISKFVTIKKPDPFIDKFVALKNGSFYYVNNNPDRIIIHDHFVKEKGWVSFDQHNNPKLIDAFRETLGYELVQQIKELKTIPKFLVAPIGTGGMIAGISQAFKENNIDTTIVGCDISSSIVHQNKPSISYDIANCRGVGSEDEYCGTYLEARKYIDVVYVSNIYNALNEIHLHTKNASFTIGMSSCLAIDIVKNHLLRQCDKNSLIIVMAPDRGESYDKEIQASKDLFWSSK